MKILKTIFALFIFCACFSACTEEALDSAILQERQEGNSPLSRAVENPYEIADFRKTYGVGFSFDGIYGELCNLRDVKCQVLDYKEMQKWSQAETWRQSLVRIIRENKTEMNCKAEYNRDEYIQRSLFHADLDAQLLIFNGKYTTNVQVTEAGVANSFFCDVEYRAPNMQVLLDSKTVQTLIKRSGQTQLLTPNFREVLEWLKKHHDDATIDSFINRYGSHVVTYANLGGSINMVLNMQKDSLTDIYSEKALGDAAIMAIFKSTTESSEYKKIVYMLNSADCRLSVKGGDLSCIPYGLLHFTFGERPDLSTFISHWVSSIRYDQENFQNSNLEMIDMRVTPIWEFIPDKDIASLVKSRVIGVATEMQRESSLTNSVNTVIELPQEVTCNMGGNTATYTNPQSVNVIVAGRYVAAICSERIDAINPSGNVQVVYPISDRQVNLQGGLCVYQGTAYRVKWLNNDKMVLNELGPTSLDNKVYLNKGVADTIRYENLDYQEAHLVMDYEWPYSIQQDGTLDKNKPFYWVYKSGSHFFLRNQDGTEQRGELDGLPNCIFSNGRMEREPKYHYYWNPLEVNY